MYHIRSYCAV